MTLATVSLVDETIEEGLKKSVELEQAQPETILRWAVEEFGADVALATGFGAEGCVLIAMLAAISPRTRIFYLDTDLLFPETYALRNRLAARYGVQFERKATGLSLEDQAREYGPELWKRDPDLCCRLRKVEPLREMLSGLRAWVTGIRREQSAVRRDIEVIEWDEKFGLLKINPLAAWSKRDLWNYITSFDVPYNPLHDHGYPSIGCVPCTSAVQIGEAPRAGRWRGRLKTECGLHG